MIVIYYRSCKNFAIFAKLESNERSFRQWRKIKDNYSIVPRNLKVLESEILEGRYSPPSNVHNMRKSCVSYYAHQNTWLPLFTRE
jgi:hypothetical protein